ncbi:PREDICTED: agamous-like MADS-box protein AGL62 [Lupinus angustifolius]|uniref:agamous-like MADS-box protein AGL62 n=1 Tax=Lupinus angustifolius TaxID=3871 RepID=UPI00092E383B|nr:PREDICTED: agamous-like MADS-box protein AGL62 [Lupinus angustifolius]
MSNSIPSSCNPIPSSSNPKKNKGRRRIEMKMIVKDINLQVTFSKHRIGLFKKTSELCTLCNAKVGLVVFSPANKAFSFGDPSIDVIVDRYQMRDQPLNLGNRQYLQAHRNANVQELNDKINRINEDLEIEKKSSEELAKQRKEAQELFWWCIFFLQPFATITSATNSGVSGAAAIATSAVSWKSTTTTLTVYASITTTTTVYASTTTTTTVYVSTTTTTYASEPVHDAAK